MNTIALMKLVIESQYFSPFNVFKYSILATDIYLDVYENFRKGSFRNRCIIAGANNLIHLTVPLLNGRNQRAITKEIKIANHLPWQRDHWRSLFSAYGKSPWFSFYQPDLENYYRRTYKYLLDWNLDLMEWVHRKLKINPRIHISPEKVGMEGLFPENQHLDLRDRWHPNNFKLVETDNLPHYSQVFEERWGFQPNLSILDLLFCEGPLADQLLMNQFPRQTQDGS